MTRYDSTAEHGLLALFARSLRQPEFWAYSTWLEIVTKYRRTSLGVLWLCLPLVVFILVLGNVYAHLMSYSPATYLPYLGVGYVLWRFIVQVINDSVSAFTSHRSLVMEGNVRLTDFVLSVLAKAGFHFFFGALVVAAVFAWSPVTSFAMAGYALLGLPLMVVNMAWVAVCCALVGARFPDTRETIGTVLMLGLLLTPILWPADRFPIETTRGLLVRLNPAFHLIDLIRAPLMGTQPEPSSWWVCAGMMVAGWALACLVYRRYSRFVPLWV